MLCLPVGAAAVTMGYLHTFCSIWLKSSFNDLSNYLNRSNLKEKGKEKEKLSSGISTNQHRSI